MTKENALTTDNTTLDSQFLVPQTHQTAAGLKPGKIVAMRVTDARRLAFLPRCIGVDHMVRFESSLYSWARRRTRSYTGGFWHFYDLMNGGCYAAPEVDNGGSFEVYVQGNQFGGTVSADAFGIIVSLFALCQLCNETKEDRHVELYHSLRAYANEHAESRAIFRAID